MTSPPGAHLEVVGQQRPNAQLAVVPARDERLLPVLQLLHVAVADAQYFGVFPVVGLASRMAWNERMTGN